MRCRIRDPRASGVPLPAGTFQTRPAPKPADKVPLKAGDADVPNIRPNHSMLRPRTRAVHALSALPDPHGPLAMASGPRASYFSPPSRNKPAEPRWNYSSTAQSAPDPRF